MDVYLGMIFPWAAPWCPAQFAFCDGSLLQINTYMALFSLLGTVYGGDGVKTFGLPDLRSRLPLGCNNGNAVGGLTKHPLGATGGAENVQLALGNMPIHSHAITGSASITGSLLTSSNAATTSDPSGNYIANANFPGSSDGSIPAFASNSYVPAANAGTPVAIGGLSVSGNLQNLVTQVSGGTTPVNVTPPFTVVNYIIAVNGIYPSRQ